MTLNGSSNTDMSPMKQALQAIKQLQTRIAELENGHNEPIAVVSMACKFPGNINNTRDLWESLLKSHDAIIEVPSNRWNADEFFDPDPEVPGKMYTKLGGFLDVIDQFDPAFFGISPREAASMDPHQRLLLQTTWEAFENGGFDINALYGSKTGVYVGISNFEYGANLIWPANPADITSYSGTGGSLGVTAGRLSYTFGFTGPSMIIDTACSSSLVTTHLAMQALRLGECDVAVSAGVNLIFGPQTHINFCKAKMLAADGHCKTFSDDADGYARGEGIGVIVLKRLSDAEKDGDNILALLRGSAVNQDGPSGGLTVPNGPSQVKVIKSALENAAIDPSDIGYIEAHGTGTALGDPIEMSAIEKVFVGSSSNRKHPLQVSSIKTNLGHLESAAGIAGIIKTILIVQNGQIPPHRNFRKPNPLIDWNAFPVEIPLSVKAWSDAERIAGVSSFSFSGTNSHVIISNYTGNSAQINEIDEDADKDVNPVSKSRILVLSAKNDANLEALADHVAQELATLPQDKWSDYCRSFAIGRGHFAKRLIIKADSPQSASKQLIEKSFQISKKLAQRPRIAFLFTGQGAQFINMGKQLYEEVPYFRSMMDQCDSIVSPIIGQSLLELIYPKLSEDHDHDPKINQTKYTQPALFAFEYSLARLWQHIGIEPDAVIGHSLGELVAATISGLFSLEDALELVCARGRLMTELCEDGSMASISSSGASVVALLTTTGLDSKLSIATINGPESTVVAGDTDSINLFLEHAESAGHEVKKLAISHASHSPLSDPMLAPFEKIVGDKSFGKLDIPIISNISGKYADESLIGNASYWADHIRQPVNFNAGIETLIDDGYEVFIEIGPKPILSAFGRDIAATLGKDTSIHWLPSLRKNIEPFDQIQLSLGQLYLLGIDESITGRLSVGPRYPIQVANTPFITKRYWYSHSDHQNLNRITIPGHSLLGEQLNSPAINKETNIFRNELSANSSTFLAHHEVFGEVVLPAAAHLETALAAGKEVFKSNASVSDVTIHSALILPRSKSIQIQTIVRTSRDETEFEIYSTSDGQSGDWDMHSSGKLRNVTMPQPKKFNLPDLQNSHPDEIEVDSYYRSSRALGIAHGEHFQAMKSLHRGKNGYLGELILPAGVGGITDKSFFIHPVLLDAAFQMASYPLIDLNSAFLPTGLQSLNFFAHLDHTVWCYVNPVTETLDENLKIYETDLWLLNTEGEILVKIEKLRFQRVDLKMLPGQRSKIDEWLYEMEWQKRPISGDAAQSLLAPNQVVKKLKQKSDDVATHVGFYGALFSEMDELSSIFIQDALLQCGWNPAIGDSITNKDLIRKCEITQEFEALFIRSLGILAEDGIVKRNNDHWEVVQPFNSIEQKSLDHTYSQFPQAKSELTLFFRCASKLRNVWQGSVDPLSLLFPESGDSVATLLYKDSIGSKQINELLAEAISNIIDTVPAYKKLRFLEIGGGTGGTTTRILPKLPADRCDYLFTDISAHFTQQASKLFSEDFPFVRYATLDIEKEPSADHVGNYEVIIAANVVHATQNLTQTLAYCQKMLAPGGIIVLLEASAKQRWLDLTFGMTDGWWRFSGHDTLRNDYPLLTTETWKSILDKLGFESVTIIGEESKSINEGLRQHVILSKKPLIQQDNNLELSGSSTESKTTNATEARENWLIVGKKSPLTNQLAKNFGKNCIILDSEELVNSSDSVSSFLSDVNRILMVHPLEFGKIDQHVTGKSVMKTQRRILMPVVGIIQSLLKSEPDRLPKLFITSREAIATLGNSNGLIQSGLIGLVNTIKSEYPEMQPLLIDLPGDSDVNVDLEFILSEIKQQTGENQVIFRNQQRWVNRLKRYTIQTNSDLNIRADGSYLITGGLGEIGLMTAQFLASKGAGKILLMGRKSPSSKANEIIQKLINKGIQIEIITGDVSDEKSLHIIMDSKIKDSLKGVVHAAGTLEDGVISSLTWEQMQNVMDAKVSGAWNLHSQTQGLDLDFFILFSSIGSVFGPAAQANYATANSFMDQLAMARVQSGQPALVINWGAWSDIGLAARHAQQSQVAAMQGINLIQPDQGMAVFDRIWNQQGQIIAVPVKWPELFTHINEMPLLSTIRSEMTEKQAQNNENSSWIEDLSTLPANKRVEVLTQHVSKQVSKVLGSDIKTLDVTIGFFDLGMDSLTSVELRNALQGSLGINLPSTLIFKYPTIEAVSEFLAETLDLTSTGENATSTLEPKIGTVEGSAENSGFTAAIKKDVAEMTEEELNALIDDEFMNLTGDDD
jgi:acyl transferase domain-containing protein/acyl carrier protein/SAM-dependent methyltransferase